jgi:hypothetical protein
MEVYVIKEPIKRKRLGEIAKEGFGDVVKAAVDVRQEIMAVGGELHSDEEVLLIEKHDGKREDIWGINIYTERQNDERIEFDSMINIKPAHNNRSCDVEDDSIKESIRGIVKKLVID